MTVEIYNNSTSYNIYPVLFAGAPSDTDTWMQACFQLKDAQLDGNPYPRATQYRMYINCCAKGENGIPPGGSVTITLPLYSPLVGSIDPKKSGQLIDWWQGGGINFYRGPVNEYGTSDGAAAALERRPKWQRGHADKTTRPPAAAATCISLKPPPRSPIMTPSS